MPLFKKTTIVPPVGAAPPAPIAIDLDEDVVPPTAPEEPASTRVDAEPPVQDPPVKVRKGSKASYVVWAHGSVNVDGKYYQPGDTVELTPIVAAGYGPALALAE